MSITIITCMELVGEFAAESPEDIVPALWFAFELEGPSLHSSSYCPPDRKYLGQQSYLSKWKICKF
jgi:hypothetical protein